MFCILLRSVGRADHVDAKPAARFVELLSSFIGSLGMILNRPRKMPLVHFTPFNITIYLFRSHPDFTTLPRAVALLAVALVQGTAGLDLSWRLQPSQR